MWNNDASLVHSTPPLDEPMGGTHIQTDKQVDDVWTRRRLVHVPNMGNPCNQRIIWNNIYFIIFRFTWFAPFFNVNKKR